MVTNQENLIIPTENEDISESDNEMNSRDFLRKKEYLESVKKELEFYKENSKVVLLILKINTFLRSLETKNLGIDSMNEFCLVIEKKLKNLNIKIGKDNGLLEEILSIVGNNSQRFPEYRVIQYQIIFIFLACSKIKLKYIRSLTLEQIKSALLSSEVLDRKGLPLIKEKMPLIEIFFEKYSHLGCSLKKKTSSLMTYQRFVSMVSDELKRVLKELNRVEEGLDLIKTGTLKYSLEEFNFF